MLGLNVSMRKIEECRAQGHDLRTFLVEFVSSLPQFACPKKWRNLKRAPIEASLTGNLCRAYQCTEPVATRKPAHVVLTKRAKWALARVAGEITTVAYNERNTTTRGERNRDKTQQ
jgi:hypothetical protein